MFENYSAMRKSLSRVLIGQPFWGLWGGKILATVIMACVVTLSMQSLEHGVKELVDTTVQNTLMADMVQDTHALPACDGSQLINCISVIGIDNDDFRETFKQTSPLNPDLLRSLVDALAAHPPKVVAIDLDLSPASVDDKKARDALRTSLHALARVSGVVMVCPQGFSTTEPGPLDKEWVERFGPEVQFASPTLSEDGLYYEHNPALSPLGVVATQLARGDGPKEQASSWLEACNSKEAADTGHSGTEEKQPLLIRPSHAMAHSFAQAMQKPEAFAGHVVFIGGKWGINDQFHLRGQTDPVYGVTLHAWVAASELMVLKAWPNAAMLAFELGIGLFSGFVFSQLWDAIAKTKKRNDGTGYGLRSCLYVLFLVLTVAVPIGWIVVSAHLAKAGIVFGAAGMVLAASADSFLSAHEQPMSGEEEKEEESRSAQFWLRLGSAVLVFGAVFFVLHGHGESLGFAAACGAAVGLFAGAWDRSVAPAEHHEGNDNWFDLAMRVVWFLLKAVALAYMAMHHYESPTRLMLISFLLAWWATYFWPTKARLAKAAVPAKT